MRAGLALVLTGTLTSSGTVGADECHRICADVASTISFKSGCINFRSALPRPKVARHCQDGYKAAVRDNCYDACIHEGRIRSFLAERRLDEVCYRTLKEAPRPLCHDACVQGYRAGVKDVSTELVRAMSKVDPHTLSVLTKDDAPEIAMDASQAAEVNADVKEALIETAADSSVLTDGLYEGQGADTGERLDAKVESEEWPASGVDYRPEPMGPRLFEGMNKQSSPSTAEEGRDERQTGDAKNDTNQTDMQTGEGGEHGERAERDEDDLVLALPITVDDTEKELKIYNSDEPMGEIVAFCAENMPDEGDACADQLLRVVQHQLANI